MESVQFLTAEKMKAKARLLELNVNRQAKEDSLNAFLKYNGEIIKQHHQLINELEEATKEANQHLMKHLYL